ncbi:MAG: leucine--tRNA ligase, partial [Candidatus Nitrosotenuis sp.]
APHIAEEMWERLGNPGLASRSEWPRAINEADKIAMQSEELLQSTIEDIKNVLKVTKISPQKIILYTADSWKSKAFQKIAKSVISGQTNIGAIIKDLIADPETENIKKDPDFVKKSVNSILAESIEMRKIRADTEPIDEGRILASELSGLVKKEFAVDIQVFAESDPSKFDPKNKARMARPFKPALYIE